MPDKAVNLNEFLPPYGANRIKFSYGENKFHIGILFDGPIDEDTISLEFENPAYTSYSVFPGPTDPSLLDYAIDSKITSGVLTRLENSMFAEAWNEHYGRKGVDGNLKHFILILDSTSSVVHVLAEDVLISKG